MYKLVNNVLHVFLCTIITLIYVKFSTMVGPNKLRCLPYTMALFTLYDEQLLLANATTCIFFYQSLVFLCSFVHVPKRKSIFFLKLTFFLQIIGACMFRIILLMKSFIFILKYILKKNKLNRQYYFNLFLKIVCLA